MVPEICYSDAEVRAAISDRRRQDRENFSVDFSEDSPEPDLVYGESTEQRPGSIEKVKVLERRVKSGEHLWHPDDVDMAGFPGGRGNVE